MHAAELSVAAAKAGADGLLLVTPYYNKCTQKGAIAHFNYIVEQAKIPAIIYNVPSRTAEAAAAAAWMAQSPGPLESTMV